jgi:glycosyltransferase involved in cell wall biosynthesis
MLLESDGPGGAEYMLIQLAEELRRRGHSIIPVGPAKGLGWLDRVLRERGFDPHRFTLRRPLDWQCLKGLAATLRRSGVDVVHGHEFTMALYGTAAARLIGKPAVITIHSAQYVSLALRRRLALSLAARSSRAMVAVSSDTARTLEQRLWLRSGAVTTIHNGIIERPGRSDGVRDAIGARPDEILLLAVGNLYPVKGHPVLLDALQRLQDAAPARWRLVVAGRGRNKAALEERAATLGLRELVHFLGHRDDVPDLLAAADVFVMPSLREGLPLAILEAMFAGKAIVASGVGGIPEAITSGEHGILVEPGDPAALSEALRALLSDPAVRLRLGDAARRRAQAEFRVGEMADRYERIYRESVRRDPSR